MRRSGSKSTEREAQTQSERLLKMLSAGLVNRYDRPIMGLIGGVNAAPGRVMGHAGAFVAPGEADALTKFRALENAGVVMTNHPAKFGDGMKKLLGSVSKSQSAVSVARNQGTEFAMC